MNSNAEKPNPISTRLNDFYVKWSSKDDLGIQYDIEVANRKANVIFKLVPNDFIASLKKVLDYGCGYGAFLHRFSGLVGSGLHQSIGVDFSDAAITAASQIFCKAGLVYKKLPSLDIKENRYVLEDLVGNGVDVILLIDVLEHVTDCNTLIQGLSEFSELFLIKLPIESSLIDNYFLPKEYPSVFHSNGHLREFDANNVHYFVRELGLTPIFETLYLYDNRDLYPPLPSGAPIRRKLVRLAIMLIKSILLFTFPKKIYMRIAGGGGYICLASFNQSHILYP